MDRAERGCGALPVTGEPAVLVALMKVPAVSNVPLFWSAFVLTRSLGATVGDFLTKPVVKGGSNLGTIGSPAVLLAVLFGLLRPGTRAQGRPPAHGSGAGHPVGRVTVNRAPGVCPRS
ncbi:putative membrane-anchored protein [Streptomyces griseochromogenes]|uniref:Membrane-anchored protein n=2 Tax=Streptomyces griseochromogenes TaxID=68214 RepID=A0ABS4LK80_9ACTN|nr:putative membrane-anchored protein [Streptomyces griseochromogenes]